MAEAPAVGQLRVAEPMARHVSWRAGGAAARFYVPASADDLADVLSGLPAAEPVLLVGLGSNLLVRDGGYAGTVVAVHKRLGALALAAGGLVRAEAGVASPHVARFAARHGHAGAEFLAGIPGTVGGALAMNAGCYGAETWERVVAVETVDRRGGRALRTPAEYEIGYRHVRLKSGAEEWFTAAHFRFPAGDGETSRAVIKTLLARRVASQPLQMPNAGSVFRNPPGDFAARLVEASGLKGAQLGGARVSERHANFIVNVGGARAADIEALIDRVERTVWERQGVRLVREVRIVGEA